MIANFARRAAAATTACLLAAFLLSGCASIEPELGGNAAQRLQSQVLTVTEHAAANDHMSALNALEELAEQLDAAAADGEVSFKRHQSISSAIETVRADLAAAHFEAQAKAAEAAEAASAASASPSPAPAAPSQQEAPGKQTGNDDDGKGDDQGKGKGKDDD